MKYVSLTLTFLFLSLITNGQNIKFKSEFEKEVLTNIEGHSKIELLLAISVSDSEKLLDEVKVKIEI